VIPALVISFVLALACLGVFIADRREQRRGTDPDWDCESRRRPSRVADYAEGDAP